MNKKMNRKAIIVLFLGVLIIAAVMDFQERLSKKDNQLIRPAQNQAQEEFQYQVSVDDVLEDYSYQLSVMPQKPSKEEAYEYMDMARAEVEKTFCPDGEKLEKLQQSPVVKKSYVSGLVTAKWEFMPFDCITEEGVIDFEQIPKEGKLIQAEVTYSCGAYQQIDSFSFEIYPPNKSKKDIWIQKIQEAVEKEQEKEGKQTFQLPEEIDGKTVHWKQEKSHWTIKILFLEGICLILYHLAQKERQRKEEEMEKNQMRLDYAEIVSSYSILIGAGMTTRQALDRIIFRYDQKKVEMGVVHRIYEELSDLKRDMDGGRSEREAYQSFAESVKLNEYRRLARMIILHIQKGSRDLAENLEKEAQLAFEERKLLAKKIAEETGTKLLFPLVLMLAMVIAIIIMPAILEFKI